MLLLQTGQMSVLLLWRGRNFVKVQILLGRLDCSGTSPYIGKMVLDLVGGEKFCKGCLGVDRADEEWQLLLGHWGWDGRM